MPHTTNDTKPLYAVAGLADLAVAKLRALPAQVPGFTERAESAATSAREKLAELPAGVQRFRAELPADVQKLRAELPASIQKLRAELPSDVQRLRGDVPTILHNAQTRLVKFSGEVAGAYDGLSERGQSAVKRFGNERAGELETVTVKVADAADKAADAADKMADELAEDQAKDPSGDPSGDRAEPRANTASGKRAKAETPNAKTTDAGSTKK